MVRLTMKKNNLVLYITESFKVGTDEETLTNHLAHERTMTFYCLFIQNPTRLNSPSQQIKDKTLDKHLQQYKCLKFVHQGGEWESVLSGPIVNST